MAITGSTVSGPRTLRVTGHRGADIGDNTMITLGTSNAAHQVTVRNQTNNQPLSLRLVPYFYYRNPSGAGHVQHVREAELRGRHRV